MHIANIKDDPRCVRVSTTPGNDEYQPTFSSPGVRSRKSSLARFLSPSNFLGTSTPQASSAVNKTPMPSVSKENQRTSLTLDESYSQSPLADQQSRPSPSLASISEQKGSLAMDKLEELLDGPNGQFVALLLACIELEDNVKSVAREAVAPAAERLGMNSQDFSCKATLLKGPGTSEFGFVDEQTQIQIDDSALPSRIPVTLSVKFDEKAKDVDLILKANAGELDEMNATHPKTEIIVTKISLLSLTQVVNGRRKALANDYPDLRSVPSNQFCTLVATPSLDIMFRHASARDSWGNAFTSIIHTRTEGDQLWNVYSSIKKALV